MKVLCTLFFKNVTLDESNCCFRLRDELNTDTQSFKHFLFIKCADEIILCESCCPLFLFSSHLPLTGRGTRTVRRVHMHTLASIHRLMNATTINVASLGLSWRGVRTKWAALCLMNSCGNLGLLEFPATQTVCFSCLPAHALSVFLLCLLPLILSLSCCLSPPIYAKVFAVSCIPFPSPSWGCFFCFHFHNKSCKHNKATL